MKQKVILTEIRRQTNRMTFAEVNIHFTLLISIFIFLPQIEQDAYQDDLGFSLGQLGKGGVGGPIRGPAAVDKKTQISISKRLQVIIYMYMWDMYMNSVLQLDYNFQEN